jgi:RHS repeat-associated protein
VATANSLDVTAATHGNNASPNSGNATTTVSGDLLLGVIATADAESFTTGSGIKIEEFVPAEPNTKLIVEYQLQQAAGTAASSASLGASDPWGAILATFKAAPAGGTAPSITSVSPTAGAVGASVTLTGTNFGATQGSSTVTFNRTAATPTSWSATNVVAPVPSGATTGNVVVTVGGQASNGVSFTVISAPTISGFSPTSASFGILVTVTGTNFTANGATPLVNLSQQGGGTIPASVSSASATSLSFVVPTGAATGPVTVTASGQSAVSSGALTITAASSFTIAAAPSSATLLPGQSTTYQVSLTSSNGFTQLAALSVSGVPSGVTASFQPPQITAGQFSILTLNAPSNQAPSATQLTIGAGAIVQGTTQSSSANVTLNVQGTSGVTFAGRAAVTDAYETPLVGLTVRMMGVNQNGVSTGCTGTATTDGSGNFMLGGLSASCAGGQLVQYDPSTVTSPPGTYSGVTLSYSLTSGQVTTPGIIVHLPRVNNAETFSIQQNASVDQTFTSSSIPGVTITVYAGTTFTLANGTQPNPFLLSVVEIPIDRLPDAMPPDPTQDPVFAMSIEPFNSSSSQPIAVTYPNRSKMPPGTSMPLTSLNPTLGMMVNYGTATVSANGAQIIPDLDSAHTGHRFGISHFDWHLPEPGPNPRNPCSGSDCSKGGDPVDLASGLLSFTKTDMVLGGARGQVAIIRTFRGATTNAGPFGIGTNHNYGYLLDMTNVGGGLINLIMPDGNQFPFVQSGTTFANTTIPLMAGAVISNVTCNVLPGFTAGNPNACSATLRWKNGTTYQFQPLVAQFPNLSFLMSITDSNGNKTTLTRSPSSQLTQITDPVGRTLTLAYDSAGRTGRITSITDPIGRSVQYTYTSAGFLQTVTDVNKGVTTYGYDSNNNLKTITDARQITYLTNNYDPQTGLVTSQQAADGGTITFAYTLSNPTIPTSPVLLTSVTDPLGNQTTYHFNPAGFVLDVTDALGRKTIYTRDAGTNLLLSVTDPLNRTTAFTYDSTGNTTSVTRLAGTANAVITSFSYEPTFNKLATITDPLGHVTSFAYDKAGNLTQVTDPLNHQTTLAYDGAGELIAAIDPLGNTTRSAYDGFGNLVQATDPLGRTVSRVADGVGRGMSLTSPLSQTTQSQYNPFNQITQITDPLSGPTSFTYDPNGNLLTLTDALGSSHVTTYTYDNMDRLATRKDPLGNSESNQYDKNGNLIQFTDRRGKITTYQYDAVNRRTSGAFGPNESTIKYTYDAANRLIQVTDSITGTITRSYDSLDRLTSEVTPLGSVSYSYDAAGRRASMSVSGQSRVTYSYNNASRLTQITQGTGSVAFGYDGDNRRTSLTLQNGIAARYGYDAASQLSGITYILGSTTLGNLTYSYDLAGRRISTGGSFARTGLPGALTSASYNVSNQVAQFGPSSLVYDANGNLTSDSVNTYTWNARNQLISISGRVSASFQYDPFGRRVSKTIGATTQFLYDWANPVQEISGTTASANLLSGGVDEMFQRTDSAGSRNLLVDALGSVIVLADSNGTLQTQYTFEPFGNTSVAGTVTTNSFAYTGRELDATGLYYYRARYYSPVLQRFISEDPVGMAAGTNLYRYTFNDPIDKRDPSGLYTGVDDATAIAAGIVLGLLSQAISDTTSGHLSGVSTYYGAIVGGAAAGETTLYLGPVAGGLAGAATGNLVKQTLDNVSGDQSGLDLKDLGSDAMLGAAVGLVPDGSTAIKGLQGQIQKGLPGSVLGGVLDAKKKPGGGAPDGGGRGKVDLSQPPDCSSGSLGCVLPLPY